MRNSYRTLLIKCTRKRLLWRPNSKWEDYVKFGFKEMGLEGVDWIQVAYMVG
jgi:hypothetical protein